MPRVHSRTSLQPLLKTMKRDENAVDSGASFGHAGTSAKYESHTISND